MDIVERLRSRKAYTPEYNYHGEEIIGDEPDEDCQNAADEIEQLRKALQYAVDQYGKPGGPWNVPGSKGSWIDQAKKALNYKGK